ncbi:glycosyltransferase involved in cell wall biosynthesis [Dysgonomonadaceae bacterium PH5-43]|nr:glycosyltransferase involved in cell wall biosynthesis [Dysgonomonadaceae bacterium PH5-43]
MRISFLSSFYPFRGGIAQFNALLYKALEEQGHTLKAFNFTCQYPSLLFPGKTQYVTENDNAIHIDSEAVLSSVNPISYETSVKKILAWKPDVVIFRYWMSFFAPAFGHVANRLRKKGVKVVAIVDNALPHEPRFFDKPFAKLFFSQVDGFVVMSDIVERDLISIKPDAKYIFKQHPLYNHFGNKLEKDEAKDRLFLDKDKRTLLFFGLIRDYKGLDILLDAMNILDDSYQLVIAGEPYGSFEKYQIQINNSSAKDRIKLICKYISDDEVPALFSAADLLVLPYKSATQSGVIPVAYHFEVPTVATDVGGLKMTLEVPQTGVVKQPDAKDIALGIEEVFTKGLDYYVSNIKKEKQLLSWSVFADTLTEFIK